MADQENLYDYYERAKEIAKAEKALAVERWVKVDIYYHDDQDHYLHHYDMPAELYDRWSWVVRWRRARLQCLYPRQFVQCAFCYYRKYMGLYVDMQSDIDKLVSSKAQVSRQQHLIDEYISAQRASNIFFDEASDEALAKIRAKLAQKLQNVQDAEARLADKVKEYQHKVGLIK